MTVGAAWQIGMCGNWEDKRWIRSLELKINDSDSAAMRRKEGKRGKDRRASKDSGGKKVNVTKGE